MNFSPEHDTADHISIIAKRKYTTTESYKCQENVDPISNTTKNYNDTVMCTLEKILQNQETIRKEQIDTSNKLSALQNMLAENNVITKATYKATQRWFGKSLTQKEEEVSKYLPLKIMAEVNVLEHVLLEKENEDAMRTLLICRKRNQTLDEFLKLCITDECLFGFNWDGRCGKPALNKFKFFLYILKDFFSNLDKNSYDKEMRKAIDLAYHRFKQKQIYAAKKLNKTF